MSGAGSKRGGDSARGYNRASVMKLVLEEPGIDRTRLADATGLTTAAMTRIVQELISAGLLKDVGALATGNGRGRKRSGLEIVGPGGFVLGLSILAFNSSIALTDMAGRTIETVRIDPTDIGNPQSTLDEIAAAAQALITKHKLDKGRILGAGAAIAGYLNSSGEVWDRSPYLGWPAFNVRRSLAERLKLDVTVDNVNRCIAVAESRMGCCAGTEELVLIRAALGLGGAIINAGEVLRGHTNQAGHIGHIPVDPDGQLCSCGARGCLNTIASGWAILDRLGLSDAQKVGPGTLESQENRLKKVLDLTAKGDPAAENAVREAGELLALHSKQLLFSLDPQAVVLTGPLGRNAVYCEAFRKTLTAYGITARIVTAHDHQITGPAPAAAALALATQVYAPSFDIRQLFADAPAAATAGSDEALVL
ncbi:ROK family transcriptional regulator [Pelagibius sp. Alg239-R121]|uniref:ROK family transcriptional regulator n=1 Tax=Pelagibius sp. Alg239-R121 TaxID=2993448 RepID=UPI0024A7498C|nr:ROK family transcriptional regulator [Pelagibius sp. Alg239-R121]